jgi:hypothetical protein
MILYVNGDSHAAAAECVNPHAWAEDDVFFYGLGRRPHPDNERASFGCELANWLNAILLCDAQAGGSNDRIMRTTQEWIANNEVNLHDTLIVIQWSTWEREEWLHNNIWWQVNASGIDDVPQELQEKYRNFIIGIDWGLATQQAHNKIWQFHQELKDQNITHLFLNGNNHFEQIADRKDWGSSYLAPYDPAQTYNSILRNKGFATVNPNSWHFGPDAHCFWAEYLLQYITDNQLIKGLNALRSN